CGEPTMMTTVTLINDGFRPRTREQVDPPAADLSPTAREVLPPNACDTETPPANEWAGRAVVKGWPTLPGYEILAELGRGGMACVYKARDLRRRRLVAIKVSDPGLAGDGDIVARFRQEQLLAVRLPGLRHPNLVPACDAGQAAGLPYLVLDP